ncbi:MAG: magnesium transporter [Candidatus Omnitrophica bacterium]|nr:magnesium transporter [Candidatus Omnitrophota bacterium]
MKLFLYFSEIIGLDILDAQGEWAGTLHDIAMNPQGDIYPKATQLVIRRGLMTKEYALVPWNDLAYIENEARLKLSTPQIQFQRTPFKCDFTLRRDILDQQIVDTDNQKVERVNDIHLLRVENQLYAAHVDVGLRALVRRLEWTALVDILVKLLRPRSPYLTQEELVPWKNTQVLPKLGRMKSVVRLDVTKSKLSGIPPAALAEIMQDLDVFARTSLFKSFEGNLQPKVFTDMSMAAKQELIDQLDERDVAQLISNIPADEATDVLMKLPRHKTQQFMRLMETQTSKKLRKLLGFAGNSAGGLMTTEYLYLKQDATVADGWQKIKDNANAQVSIFFLYIVDENHKYLGTTSLRRFINEDSSTPLMKTCYHEHVYVYTDAGMEEVALLLERYKFSSLPVLNRDDILQGVITIDDVLEELISLAWSKYKKKL